MLCTVVNCGEREWSEGIIGKVFRKKEILFRAFFFWFGFSVHNRFWLYKQQLKNSSFVMSECLNYFYSQVRPFITMHTWDLLQRGPCWWEGYPFVMCSIGLQLNCLINIEKKSKITWTKHRSPKVRRLFFFEQRTVICLMQASEVEKWYWHTLTLISHSN